MSYFEGIGDEVLITVAVVTLVMVFLLIWNIAESATTSHSSPTFTSSQSVPIDSNVNQRHEHVNQISTSGQSEPVQAEYPEEEETQQEDGANSTVASEQADIQGLIQNHVSEPECATDVRQRRLDFFQRNCVDEIHEEKQNCSKPVANGSAGGVSSTDAQTEEESELPSDPELIQIRLKYLDDTERRVHTHPNQVIAEFKRVHFSDDLANNRLVRLISTGCVLDDARTLHSYGLVDSSVIHVQIQTNQANSTRPSDEAENELDIGQFLSPILGVALLCVWIMHFQYKEYFTTSATVALLVLSGLFLTFVWGQHGSRTFNTPVQ